MYLEKFKVTDRVTVVTGGASGIGFSAAQALAEAGARVIIADREARAIEKAKTSLLDAGFATTGVVITDSARVAAVADEIAAREGGIDILINNAGIARSETPAEQVADEHWLNVIDVNLNGTF